MEHVKTLYGHDATFDRLREDAKRGRLPHGLIISGIKGIGKATLARQFAHFLFSSGNAHPDAIWQRMEAGSHADLLVLHPLFDDKKGEYVRDISAEQAREIARFLSLKPAESNWRVVIIDSADNLNTHAANAILKILEEPPPNAILLLVSHHIGLLLPTIRSRCQLLRLAPLRPDDFQCAMARLLPDAREEDLSGMAQLSGGAPGRAMELEGQGALALYSELLTLLGKLPAIAPDHLHAFSERLMSEKPHEKWRLFSFLMLSLMERAGKKAAGIDMEPVDFEEPRVMEKLTGLYPAAHWASLWQQCADQFLLAERLHLDYKQAIITFFHTIATEEGFRLGSAAA